MQEGPGGVLSEDISEERGARLVVFRDLLDFWGYLHDGGRWQVGPLSLTEKQLGCGSKLSLTSDSGLIRIILEMYHLIKEGPSHTRL